jgi:hypothetical protein
MTEEKYEEIKREYVGNIKRVMNDLGNIVPHITVFGSHKSEEETKDALIHIEVRNEFMRSETMKETFVEEVLPEIANKVKEMFIPYGLAWTSEAWVRSASKEQPVPDDWKELPIDKEVLMISMEFMHKKEMIIYEIKRTGKQVNEEGDLVDHVDLIEQDYSGAVDVGGRFTNLYKKFFS